MKTFIGTKTVAAEPMNEFDAVEKGFARANVDNHEWRPGYHVVYPDGYESWSSADVFEAAYQVADTPLDRLYIERNELVERILKLSAYIFFDECSDDDHPYAPKDQLEDMQHYCHHLNNRIDSMERRARKEAEKELARVNNDAPANDAFLPDTGRAPMDLKEE
jgi:hypothetical protein